MRHAPPTLFLTFILAAFTLSAQQANPERPESGELIILEGWSTEDSEEEENFFNPPAVEGGSEILKDQIPVYYCLDSFFSLPVKVHIQHGTLGNLLEEVGVTSTAAIKALVTELSAWSSDKSGTYGSMQKYEDDVEKWEEEQYRLITEEVKNFKDLYDAFLEACADEGLDRDEIHETLVDFGRRITAMGTSGELDPRHKAALLVFEESDASNPLLSD